MKLQPLINILAYIALSESSYLKLPIIKKRYDNSNIQSHFNEPHYIIKNENPFVKREHPDADFELHAKFNQLAYNVELEIGSNKDKVTLLIDTASSDMFVNDVNNLPCKQYEEEEGPSGDENDGSDSDSDSDSDSSIYLKKRDVFEKSSCGAISYPQFDYPAQQIPSDYDYYMNLTRNIADPSLCSTFGYFSSENSTTMNELETPFNITYGDDSSAIGTMITDNVYFNGIEISNFTFGLNTDGNRSGPVLGIGYKDNQNSYQNGYNQYSSFPYHLKDLGLINKVAYSFYAPYDSSSSNAQLTFGAYDKNGYLPESGLTKVPIIKYSSRNKRGLGPYYLSITLNSISITTQSNDYKSELIATGNAAAILDTGTTATVLPYYILNELLVKYDFKWSSQVSSYIISEKEIPKDKAFITFNFQNALIKVPIIDFTYPILDGETLSNTGLRSISITSFDNDYFLLGDDFLSNIYFIADLESNELSIGQVNPQKSSESLVIIESEINDAVQSSNWDQVYGYNGITNLKLKNTYTVDDLKTADNVTENIQLYVAGAGVDLGW